MKIAGIQFDIAWQDPSENFCRVDALAREAAQDGARLIVVPEMFATGFSMDVPAIAPLAPEIRGFCAKLARSLGVHLVAGVAERPDPSSPRGLNLALHYGPDGGLENSYQKIHPFSFANECEHFDGGSKITSFQLGSLTAGVFVCYDLRFPEVFRKLADSVSLMIVIANWPAARREHWRTLLQARAIENLSYVLGVNRIGEGDGLTYSGDSLLVSPFGEILADGKDRQSIVAGEISVNSVAELRSRYSFLADRRHDVYGSNS